MKILVTGSEGTLGKPLVKELRKRGHDVFGVDLKHTNDPTVIRTDISEFRQMIKVFGKLEMSGRPIDIVYHLAAEFGRLNGEEYFEQVWKSNVIGTRNILELQKSFGFKLIFGSSSEVYGEIKADYLSEDLIAHRQKNDYAISKFVNEQQCQNFRERYGNKIMTLRFFNAYGPGEYYTPYRSVVCLFCYRALTDQKYDVYEGYNRVFMFIDDFIPTLANASNNFLDGETINIGGREYRSVKELSDIILSSLGKKDFKVNYLPQDKHNIVSKRPNIFKAMELLKHDPKIPLEEGVEKTIQWMKEVYKL